MVNDQNKFSFESAGLRSVYVTLRGGIRGRIAKKPECSSNVKDYLLNLVSSYGLYQIARNETYFNISPKRSGTCSHS